MALIIKGDMPTCCWDCDRDCETNCPLSASNEVYEEWKDVENEARHPDCPIIGEIPDKHGNLKDEKTIKDAIKKRLGIKSLGCLLPAEKVIADCIEQAPTVLEASNGNNS